MPTMLPRFKIGTNRGRRRIWLDGKRLTDAGFVGGTTYECLVRRGTIRCTIPESGDRAPTSSPPAGTEIRLRKVTGRPSGKPIIDISGKAVDTAFPDATEVKVRFEPGTITITAAAPADAAGRLRRWDLAATVAEAGRRMTLAEVKRRLRYGPWAWPGGYPLYFVCDDGEALCFACARKEYRQVVRSHRHPWVSNSEMNQWRIATYDTNWEDPDLRCAHCNERIQSAYAEGQAAPA